MYDSLNMIKCYELYNVGNTVVPFEKEIMLVGVDKGLVGIRATFDDGAMVNVIDTKIFGSIKDLISPWRKSPKVLRMVNGTLIPSGTWTGTVIVGGVKAEGSFEIFPSHGAWEALFGKPLLKKFAASHEYTRDTITLNAKGQQAVIQNDPCLRSEHAAKEPRKSEAPIASISNLGDHPGDSPLRPSSQSDNDVSLTLQEIEPKTDKSEPGSEQPEIAVGADQSIFTRALEPHKPEHI